MRPEELRDAVGSLRGNVLASHTRAGGGIDLESRVAVALAKALVGPTAEAQREAHEAFTEAQTRKDAARACDAMSVRALAEVNLGDLERATELARRASMMSRTESLREQEILANLVLARVRRLTGKPFLATRILSAVQRFASPTWAAWIRWELVMASGASPTSDADVDAEDPSASLARMIECARTGDRSGFDREASATAARVQGLLGHGSDLMHARLALDPEAAADGTDLSISRWRSGIDSVIPFGLLGLASSPDDDASVLILARPDRKSVRLLAPGAHLATSAGAGQLPSMQRKQGRTDTALAALALAGPLGLGDEVLFRAAYGFEFSHNVHAGVFDVLLHRARTHLGDAGDIVRADARVALTVRGPLLLTDPRQGAREDDRVLQLVARRGRLTAKDTSQELGIPLRSAQAALEALLSSGACSRERNGRSIEYRVDDTTFQEPTDQHS